MRAPLSIGIASLAVFAGCGLEHLFSNVTQEPHPRPASVIRGSYAVSGAALDQLSVIDGDGNAVAPFEASFEAGAFELRLPSSGYAFLRVGARKANLELRALVPLLGEESEVGGVDLVAANLTETLIVEAAVSNAGKRLKQLTPAAPAYLGNGVDTGTRTRIRKALAHPDPNTTKELMQWIQRILPRYNPNSGVLDPEFFRVPEYDALWNVVTSALSASWIASAGLDYDGDGLDDTTSAKFDAKLAAVADLYEPGGCDDPLNPAIRVLFTSDFNQGAFDGNGVVVNRFKWAVDKPGKQIFFVGWIHADSPSQDPVVNLLLGAGVPNTKPMYDDGTNGDEVANDGIWTIVFDVPRGIRVGYKYTWGTRGAPWTGSEEWPGNSRLLEVVDVSVPADKLVYRRDVFGDEATNKDKANLNDRQPGGTITWTTDYHACGPEVHEQKFTLHDASTCGATWWMPESVGPLTVACAAP